MRTPLIVLAVLCFIPSWASNPGEPLDCSDWVFLEPGLACAPWGEPFPCGSGPCTQEAWAMGPAFDNEGRVIAIRGTQVKIPDCLASGQGVELLRYDGISEEILGFVPPRCITPPLQGATDMVAIEDGFGFDPISGRVLVRLRSFCTGNDCAALGADYNGRWVLLMKRQFIQFTDFVNAF